MSSVRLTAAVRRRPAVGGRADGRRRHFGPGAIMTSIIDGCASITTMSRTTIDIDDDALAAAGRELGTTTKVDTVNAALAYVADRRRRAAAFDDPAVWGSPELADPDLRAAARR